MTRRYNAKPIECRDAHDRKLASFGSIAVAARLLKTSHSAISNALVRGTMAEGYYWNYLGQPRPTAKRRERAVLHYSIDKATPYESIKAAIAATGWCRQSIQNSLRGMKLGDGERFSYAERTAA